MPDIITGKAARQFVQTNVTDVEFQTLSGNQILRNLSELGVRVQRGAFFQIRANRIKQIGNVARLSVIKPDIAIPRQLHVSAGLWQIRNNLQYKVFADGTRTVVDTKDPTKTRVEEVSRWLTVPSAVALTPQEIQSRALAMLEGPLGTTDKWDTVNVELKNALRRSDFQF